MQGEREFNVNQSVLVENPKGNPKWITGIITEKLGPTSYLVQIGSKTSKRHVD